MAESDEKRFCCDENGDRLTNLPTELKEEILGYLSFKDVIRTSVLSRGWRYIWRGLPMGNELEILNQIFLSHNRHVREFYLFVASSESVMTWLSKFSSEKCLGTPIQDLTIVSQKLCGKLNQRNLLFQPQEFTGFPYIGILDLCDAPIDDILLAKLIRLCPLLRALISDFKCSRLAEVMPIAVHDSHSLKTSELKNFNVRVPSLKKVPDVSCMTFIGTSLFDSPDHFVGCMSSFSGVKEFSFQFSLLQKSFNGICPTSLPTPLENLSKLHLTSVKMYSLVHLSLVLCLIRSSPKLQSLSIHIHWNYTNDERAEMSQRFFESEIREGGILSNVTTVWIREVTKSIQFISLVKVLLLRCPNLKALFIVPSSKGHKALKEIESELTMCQIYSDKIQFCDN